MMYTVYGFMRAQVLGVDRRVDRKKSYTVYIILISKGDLRCKIFKRYSDFAALDSELRAEFGSGIPRLPGKKLFRLKSKVVEQRKLALADYLQQLLVKPEVVDAVTFRRFTLLPDEFYDGRPLPMDERKEEDKQVVRVYLCDGNYKSLPLTARTRTLAAKAAVAGKLGMSSDYLRTFALLLQDGASGLTYIVDDDDFPLSALRRSVDGRLQFRKIAFLTSDSYDDDGMLGLLFIQACADVVTSIYPASPSDLAVLAAHKAQALFGDMTYAKLEPFREDAFLASYIPKPEAVTHPEVRELGVKSSAFWEGGIGRQWERLKGMSPRDAKMAYLNIVREWDFYGADFFPVAFEGGRPFPAEVFIAVKEDGILVLNKDSKSTLAMFLYDGLEGWSAYPSKFRIITQGSKQYDFKTKRGFEIQGSIDKYTQTFAADGGGGGGGEA
eukprot:PLAT178.1.p1 GENE.PLAT178.1~~PLAT178.1.p1  ORF type:complete len:440 (-),score=275.39 PLAT178.1:246-1565(-)